MLLGALVLYLSHSVEDPWWSGTLVNAGTALFLFAPLALFGRHIEQRFDNVQEAQKEIESRQVAAAAELASLSEEVANTQGEIRKTREELADAVSRRLAASRQIDNQKFSDIGEMPSHRSLFDALTRARKLGLISHEGCRVKIEYTSLYLWFETPSGDPQFNEPPHPDEDLFLRLEDVGGSEVRRIAWSNEQDAEDVLIALAEELVSLAQYPGDHLYNPGKVFADLKELLELAHRSATGGSFEPLTSVVQYCPPQWVITSTHLIATDPGYAIPILRINEPRWHEHMSEKTWLDYDSFSTAFSTAKALYEARRLEVQPPRSKDDPPF
ncbi:hypothetical protein GCM10011608_37040 [Micromonospora sonchi]|uniref:Uncharacterized protein n=1 Tax=Micromonospora sonchi TaxID=1763543 RepID=A0A917X0N2_9ACTN|nr:hypothetical protein GCM10011608_37040 [Micromonospora sonchi]